MAHDPLGQPDHVEEEPDYTDQMATFSPVERMIANDQQGWREQLRRATEGLNFTNPTEAVEEEFKGVLSWVRNVANAGQNPSVAIAQAIARLRARGTNIPGGGPPPNPNPFGSANPSEATAEDPAVYAMIQSQTPIWLDQLKTFASKLNFNNPDQAAQEELNGILTALRTGANQARAGNTRAITPETLIGQAEARLTARAGNNPRPVPPVVPPVVPLTGGTTGGTTGGNTGNAASAGTMANIVNTPTTPYSARAALPPALATTPSMAAPAAMRPAAMAQPSMAFQPRAFQQTMQGILPPAGIPYALPDAGAENAWNRTNAQYRQAGNAYVAAQGNQMGQPYNPAPWSGTRLGAPRTALGQPEAMGSPNDVALASEADRRRAYRFGQQNAQTNQASTALGQNDFNSQMNNWLRAYNDWNNRGVDPLGGM